MHGGVNQELSNRLQKLENRTARVITQASYEVRSSDLLVELDWETLHYRRMNNSAIMMHKIYYGNTPDYLNDLYS